MNALNALPIEIFHTQNGIIGQETFFNNYINTKLDSE